MSYKHFNFKGVALKCHVLSCFDPALAMERSCSMCGICWSEVKAAWFLDLVSALGLPPPLQPPPPQKRHIHFLKHQYLGLYLIVTKGWIIFFLIISSPLLNSTWKIFSGQISFSAKIETILIAPLMIEKMTGLDRNDFAMSCYFNPMLFSHVVFWM